MPRIYGPWSNEANATPFASQTLYALVADEVWTVDPDTLDSSSNDSDWTLLTTLANPFMRMAIDQVNGRLVLMRTGTPGEVATLTTDGLTFDSVYSAAAIPLLALAVDSIRGRAIISAVSGSDPYVETVNLLTGERDTLAVHAAGNGITEAVMDVYGVDDRIWSLPQNRLTWYVTNAQTGTNAASHAHGEGGTLSPGQVGIDEAADSGNGYMFYDQGGLKRLRLTSGTLDNYSGTFNSTDLSPMTCHPPTSKLYLYHNGNLYRCNYDATGVEDLGVPPGAFDGVVTNLSSLVISTASAPDVTAPTISDFTIGVAP